MHPVIWKSALIAVGMGWITMSMIQNEVLSDVIV